MAPVTNQSIPSHPEIVKRLKRAQGQVRSIIGMLESERACLEIAQQLLAVENAIREAKKTLIRDHIDRCMDHAAAGGRGARAAIAEFKRITKYL